MRATQTWGLLLGGLLFLGSAGAVALAAGETPPQRTEPGHQETPVPPPAVPPPPRSERTTESVENVRRGLLESVQVNVDALGRNIVGDAANEPSLAIDPTDPDNIVVGWRQFDTITSDFRQAGYAYSDDGGRSWTFPGVLQPGQFRSDPVLAAGRTGIFFYYSLSTTTNAEMFISYDKGANWNGPIGAQGGDKNWLAVDATGGSGDGHLYPIWNSQFTCCAPGTDYGRSLDAGLTYQGPYATPQKPKWGTIAVGPSGEVYMAGATLDQSSHLLLRSNSARNPALAPTFELVRTVSLGGTTTTGGTPNPGGLMGQVWVAVDHSSGPTRGYVYLLGSVDPPGADPLDVHLVRSIDGGNTWSAPVRVNDDAAGSYQWFGSLSIAPDGRLDTIWNDTRGSSSGMISELRYAYSTDAGTTWSAGLPVSPPFDSTVGYPQQNKIGDYYQVLSDELGGAVIYSATFNGEQDIYFLRVGDCNANGRHDSIDVTTGGSDDCNADGVPDECEPDCNANGVADGCDLDLGTSGDCNANAVPDECDVASGGSEDCNLDGRPDECDVTLDLESNEGWTAGAAGDTATTGVWVRVDPNGTAAQPEDDHTPSGATCFVTGQGAVGGSLGENDVDGGRTTLVSPPLDVAGLDDPRIGYWRWYSNDKGSSPGQDVLRVDISADGGPWVSLETVGPSGPGTGGGWVYHSARVADVVSATGNVRLRFIAADEGEGSIIEAAVDDVVLLDCAGCSEVVPLAPDGLTVMRTAGTVANLAWNAIANAATYNLYRGDEPEATDLVCYASAVAGTSLPDDGALPPAGGSFFLVVTAENCAGESELDDGRVPAEACP